MRLARHLSVFLIAPGILGACAVGATKPKVDDALYYPSAWNDLEPTPPLGDHLCREGESGVEAFATAFLPGKPPRLAALLRLEMRSDPKSTHWLLYNEHNRLPRWNRTVAGLYSDLSSASVPLVFRLSRKDRTVAIPLKTDSGMVLKWLKVSWPSTHKPHYLILVKDLNLARSFPQEWLGFFHNEPRGGTFDMSLSYYKEHQHHPRAREPVNLEFVCAQVIEFRHR